MTQQQRVALVRRDRDVVQVQVHLGGRRLVVRLLVIALDRGAGARAVRRTVEDLVREQRGGGGRRFAREVGLVERCEAAALEPLRLVAPSVARLDRIHLQVVGQPAQLAVAIERILREMQRLNGLERRKRAVRQRLDLIVVERAVQRRRAL